MLVHSASGLLIVGLHVRSPENWSDVPTAVRRIGAYSFVEGNDQNAIPSGRKR